jgi:hypothetical protein
MPHFGILQAGVASVLRIGQPEPDVLGAIIRPQADNEAVGAGITRLVCQKSFPKREAFGLS